MNAAALQKKLFAKYGRPVTVDIVFDRYNVNAFVQHMRYRNKIYVDLPAGQLGRRDNGCYLYIGPPECDFSTKWESTLIYLGGFTYRVKRAEMIYCGKKPIYLWAVLYRTVKEGVYERT